MAYLGFYKCLTGRIALRCGITKVDKKTENIIMTIVITVVGVPSMCFISYIVYNSVLIIIITIVSS